MINKKIIGIIIVIIAILAILGAYFSTNSIQSSENEKIDAGYISLSAGHSLVFIAKEKGYFAEQGLNVEIFEFPTANDELNALSAGKLDVAVGGIGEPLVQIDNGKNFTFIGGVMSGDHGIIAKNKSIANDLQSNPESYKKYKIGTVSGIPAEVITLGYLNEQAGITKDDLDIVDFKTAPDIINAIKAGKIDVGFVYPAFQYSAEKDGLAIVNTTDELIPGLPDCRVTINSKDLNNTTAEKWIKYDKALIKAYNFYMNNHTETLDIASKYVPLKGKELEVATYNDHLSLVTDPYEKGSIKFYELLKQIGYVDGNVNVSQHFNTTIYKTALDQILKEDPNNKNYQFLNNLYETQKVD
ncbi:ABC transporter substrate-binding protein [Methanobrevibacter filiformis]|uniref:Putative aliphatic sulfonates-binding protein n=1 Tax=Methanobrevibacter filiformis TaxID=55758 RepID=A0A166AFA2_9EURY|nr:ABC transporter substrate-binding protein [Methanobrevibacter filiformis]KZX11956.1 putative aliphatic sulfonates-binding protein precursor [Methanobrevibacter filiformis]